MIRLRLGAAVALLLPLLVSGCADESLLAPDIQNDLFSSYVALGNSISAGFQSGGITQRTQQEAFPVLLAEQMNTPFGVPTLAPPGCPPPLVQLFDANGLPDPQRPSGTDSNTCALRDAPPPLQLNNFAVPGARVADVTSNQTPSTNALTQFILGGRTQIEAALNADPTFATVWIGSNNVLGPALNGTANVTSPTTFQRRYSSVLDRLTAAEHFQGGVLIGVINPVFVPFLSPGPVYYGLDQQGQFPSNFEVAANCNTSNATGLTPLVSLSHGFTLIGQALQNPNQTVTLDCKAPNDPVLTLTEVSTIAGTVQQYNAFIRQQAQNRDLAYLNPNRALGALYRNDDGDRDPTNDLIPKFPDRDSDQPFGAFFSLDGVHPSASAHRVVTNQLVSAINDQYGTALSTIKAPDVPTP